MDKQGTRELMGCWRKQLLHTTANFVQAVFLAKFTAMRSPSWQILAGKERFYHVPPGEQILHVPNHTRAPSQNITLLPEQDRSVNFPEKLSSINFNEDDFLIEQKSAYVMKDIFIPALRTAIQGTENEGVTRSETVCITTRRKLCKVSRAIQGNMFSRNSFSSTRILYKVLEDIRDYAQQLRKGVRHTSCFLNEIFMRGIIRLHHVL